MSRHKDLFTSLKEVNLPIKLGKGEIYAKGIGTIPITFKYANRRINLTLLDALYIPNLSINLISISRLYTHGIYLDIKNLRLIDKREQIYTEVLL